MHQVVAFIIRSIPAPSRFGFRSLREFGFSVSQSVTDRSILIFPICGPASCCFLIIWRTRVSEFIAGDSEGCAPIYITLTIGASVWARSCWNGTGGCRLPSALGFSKEYKCAGIPFPARVR